VIPTLDEIYEGQTGDAPLDKVSLYSERLATTLAASNMGHAFFNGKHFDVDEVRWKQSQ